MKTFLLFSLVLFSIIQIKAQPVPQNEFDTVWTRYTQSIYKLAFSPDDSKILTIGDVGIYVFETLSGTELKGIAGYNDAVFNSDGSLIVAIKESQPRISIIDVYSTLSWEKVKTIPLPDATPLQMSQVCISHDGQKIVAYNNNNMYFIEYNSGMIIKTINKFDSESQPVSPYTMLFNEDDTQLIFTGSDGKLRFFNTTTYQTDYKYDNGYGELAISNDGSMIAYKTGWPGQAVQIMNTQTKEIVQVIPVPPTTASGIAFSPDNKYLAVAYEYSKIIKIWDIQTGVNIHNYIENPAYPYTAVSWSLNGLYIAGGTSSRLFLYNMLWNSVLNPKVNVEDILYPNPTDNTINIKFTLPKPGLTQIILFGTVVNKIKIIYNSFLEQGEQNINSNVADLPSGSYTVQVSSREFSKYFKLIINK